MRHSRSILAAIAVLLPVGLLALSAPAGAATLAAVPPPHRHAAPHRVALHHPIHAAKHAAVHRHLKHSVAAG